MKTFTSDPEELRAPPRHATQRRQRRIIAVLSALETLTFAVLLVAMARNNESAVSITGLIHGLLFASYALAVWSWHGRLRWSLAFAVIAVLTGPLGAVLALERIRREAFGRAAEGDRVPTPRAVAGDGSGS